MDAEGPRGDDTTVVALVRNVVLIGTAELVTRRTPAHPPSEREFGRLTRPGRGPCGPV